MRIPKEINWPELRSARAFDSKGAIAHLFDVLFRMRKALAVRDQRMAQAINAADIEVVDAVPIDPPELGGVGLRIYDDGASDRRLYVYANGAWRYAALT